MITSTTDPITGNAIPDPEYHPFLVEGRGDNALDDALKIYFESEETKRIFLLILGD